MCLCVCVLSLFSGISPPFCSFRVRVNPTSAVLYQLRHLTSKRLEDKWPNWYSTARVLYKTSAPVQELIRVPQSVCRTLPVTPLDR